MYEALTAVPSVLLLASEFPPGPGGIGTHAHQVALQLHARGWRVSVAAPQDFVDDVAIEAFNRAQPFDVQRLRRVGIGPAKFLHRLAKVSARIRRERPDLLVGSGERMVWLAAALHGLHRIPFVAIGHAQEFNREPRWEYALTRRSFEAAVSAVCVSEYTWGRMDGCGIRVRGGEVIPNGADDQRFMTIGTDEVEYFRAAYGLGTSPLLVTVGSVHERKGQDVVIRALPEVLRHVPDVRYVVVGTPFRRDAFQALAQELGVAERVHFLGAVDSREVVRALNAASVFVMASQHTHDGDFEGFGIAVLEAALCGCPAVVSDKSGVVEAIEEGITGLSATMGDPGSTAARIVELLGAPERRDAMSHAARTRALEAKTWRSRGVAYDRLFRAIL